MTIAYATRPYVYRVYDTTGDLIYIGSTVRLWQRLSAHRGTSWWAPTVGRVHAQLHPTTTAARTAEREAILAEKPRWNRVEVKGLVMFLDQQQFHDYVYGQAAHLLTEVTRGVTVLCPHQRLRLARYKAAYQGRFGEPLNIDLDTLNPHATPPARLEQRRVA